MMSEHGGSVSDMDGPALKPVTAENLPQLCLKAYKGSSWCALLVAIHVKAKDFAELCRVVGLGPATASHEGFNAVCDAWAMYEDAQGQGANI